MEINKIKKVEIVKFNKTRNINGFTVKRGFVAAVINGHMVAVTSGWSDYLYPHYGGETTQVFVYCRKNHDWKGEWVGAWTHSVVLHMVAEEVTRRNYGDWDNNPAREHDRWCWENYG